MRPENGCSHGRYHRTASRISDERISLLRDFYKAEPTRLGSTELGSRGRRVVEGCSQFGLGCSGSHPCHPADGRPRFRGLESMAKHLECVRLVAAFLARGARPRWRKDSLARPRRWRILSAYLPPACFEIFPSNTLNAFSKSAMYLRVLVARLFISAIFPRAMASRIGGP
jgi:hypothetical protein